MENLIENIDELKNKRPDLVELYGKLSKDGLQKQCFLEAMDAINMESRVSVFMEECSNNLSKTTYTLQSLKTIIAERKYRDIREFCKFLVESYPDDEILNELKSEAKKY